MSALSQKLYDTAFKYEDIFSKSADRKCFCRPDDVFHENNELFHVCRIGSSVLYTAGRSWTVLDSQFLCAGSDSDIA